MKYANREKYVGGWKAGKRDGKGELTYSDGRIYTGDFEAGIPKGGGVLRNPMGNPRVAFDSTYLPKWISDGKYSSGTKA